MRPWLRSALRAPWLAPAALLACSDATTAAHPPVGLGLSLRAPAGLLDQADAVGLVIAAETSAFTCDDADGSTSKPAGDQPDASAIAMSKTGCATAGAWCADVTLPLDPDKRLVFAVEVRQGGTVTGRGCATTAVTSDPLAVSIVVHKVVQPAVCGDRAIEPGEDCDETPGAACDASCHAPELLLSADNASAGVTNAPKGSKRRPAAIWQDDPGNAVPNPLRVVWEDANGANGFADVDFREMTGDLLPVATPPALAGAVRLPSVGNNPRDLDQVRPAIGALADRGFVVVYEDYRQQGPSISLTALAPTTEPNAKGDVQQRNCIPGQTCDTSRVVNTSALRHSVTPAVAGGPQSGNDALALVVWTDDDGERIRGRIFHSATNTTSPAADFAISEAPGDSPRVAGSGAGWIVVWHGQGGDADDVMAATVDAAGAVGAPMQVNSAPGVQDQPAVARLAAGGWAAAWRDGAAIRMQRFGSDGAKIAGDQDQPVNDAGGAPSMPAIAAGSSGGQPFYAIGWQDDADGAIHGRFAGAAAGWLFARHTGQSASFVASDPAIAGARKLPTVAAGGAGWVAFAWQDDADAQFGIFARRLPPPTAQ